MSQTTTYIPTWTLGHRLRRAREHGGFTQEQLAHKIGVGLRAVKEGEADKNPPAYWKMLAWATACGVDPEWLETGISPAADGSNTGYPWLDQATLFDLHELAVAV